MSALGCASCGCFAWRHNTKVWPQFLNRCDDCAECTGYRPACIQKETEQ